MVTGNYSNAIDRRLETSQKYTSISHAKVGNYIHDAIDRIIFRYITQKSFAY